MAKRRAGGGVSFTVAGVKQLEQALARVGVGARTRVLRQGMRLGMDVVTALARARAPVRTGNLRVSLATVNGRTNSKWKVRVETRAGRGFYKGEAYYAAFIEFGTKKMAARPFMAPARDAGKGRAVAVARDAILDGVEAEILAAAFRKTTIGRAVTRASRAASRANRTTRRAAKRTSRAGRRATKRARKVARKATRATTRAARRTSRKAGKVGRKALKSARRGGKAFRKGAVKRARKAEKALARREKALVKRVRKALKPRRRRRRR